LFLLVSVAGCTSHRVSASAAFIESFNNRVCCEFLNAQWFHTLAEGQLKAHTWLHRYNTTHSHSALGYRTPEEFLATYETYQPPQKSVAA
jgi:transposase InsO family protein